MAGAWILITVECPASLEVIADAGPKSEVSPLVAGEEGQVVKMLRMYVICDISHG
jgi:hypothetical protein